MCTFWGYLVVEECNISAGWDSLSVVGSDKLDWSFETEMFLTVSVIDGGVCTGVEGDVISFESSIIRPVFWTLVVSRIQNCEMDFKTTNLTNL